MKEISFEENNSIKFIQDDEEKSVLLAPDSKFEIRKRELKKQLVNSLDTEEFNSLLDRLMFYLACRDEKVSDFKSLIKEFNVKQEELKEYFRIVEEENSLLKFDKDNFSFSPSSISTYLECPKKFEISKLYNMPERGAFGPSAASFGSFVHNILENGVNKKFTSKDQFIEEAKKLLTDDIDIDKCIHMIDVFWERNKDKFDDNSKTEVFLNLNLEGYKFLGFADRLDVHNDEYEIIDYKTGKVPDKEHREIQLGFYALALLAENKKVTFMTLDMLKLEKPVCYKLGEQGCATDVIGRSTPFNINAVKEKLISVAKSVEHDFETHFECTIDDNKCRYCGYKFYCPKWEEE